MEVFSIGSVAKQVGLETYELRYLLDSRDIVPDRRMSVGQRRHRYFTAEDIETVVQFVQRRQDNDAA